MAQRRTRLIGIGVAVLAAVSVGGVTTLQSASADHDDSQEFRGTLKQLNDSGVSGDVRVIDEGGHLRVKVDARGVEAKQVHLAHIHGHADGSQASCPDMSMAGPDGILSIGEGLPAYGPVFVTLFSDFVNGDRLRLDRNFRNTDPGSPLAGASVREMGSLGKFVIVVHGLTAADDGEPSNGITPGYITPLPVACAVLTAH